MAEREFLGVWIPKEVWLSEDLTLQEKCLLVEIQSLDTKAGGCWASNAHFAQFLGVGKDRAGKVVNSLVKKGYITSALIYKQGSAEVEKRIIRCTKKICLQGIGENDPTLSAKSPGGIGENAKGTNTNNNTYEKEKELDTNVSNSKKKSFTPPSLEEVKSYVTEQGYHFDANQFYQYYAVDNWHKADGTPVKNWKRCCITWESKADKTSSVPQSKSIYETL